MTLAIGVATQNYVALLSDRRISQFGWDTSGKRALQSSQDSDSKTSILNGRYLCGFSGLGRLSARQGLRMEVWMGHALKGVPGDEYFDVLAREIGKELHLNRYDGQHEFLAVGFRTVVDGRAYNPELVRVFNTRMEPHTFEVQRCPVGAAKYKLGVSGHTVSPAVMQQSHRAVKAQARRSPLQPNRIVGPLRQTLREVARSSGGEVGTSSLFTSLPVAAAPLANFEDWLDVPTDDATYRDFYVGISFPSDDSPDDPKGFGPAFISEVHNVTGVRRGASGWMGPSDHSTPPHLAPFMRN